ncbi:hypothetical protein [Natronorubrum sp. FCH18a]|uniref:hypothetical protein n=1 Tax=Natronorubrum sp. FCH18a TaxID=3447018 RepID=UPI003F519C77
MSYNHRLPFARDAIVATVILAALSGLTYGVQFRPLQLPGYILVMGFGTFGGATGPEALFPVIFGIYLISLGAVGAAIVRVVRGWIPDGHVAGWRLGVASALGVTGALAVLFTMVALFGAQPDAVFTAGILSLVFLGLASWFAGLFSVSLGRA